MSIGNKEDFAIVYWVTNYRCYATSVHSFAWFRVYGGRVYGSVIDFALDYNFLSARESIVNDHNHFCERLQHYEDNDKWYELNAFFNIILSPGLSAKEQIMAKLNAQQLVLGKPIWFDNMQAFDEHFKGSFPKY